MLFEYDGDILHLRAWGGWDPGATQESLRQWPKRPDRGTAAGRAIVERQIVHIRALAEDPEIDPSVRTMGVGSTLAVPLLRDGLAIGTIAIGLPTPGGFSDSQIVLLQTFAEQAIIAMASAAAHRAEQARTRELQQALERQTATAEVLQVINANPGNLAPVFEAIFDKAHKLCGVAIGALLTFEGETFYAAASRGFPEEWRERLKQPQPMQYMHRALLGGDRNFSISDWQDVQIDPSNTMMRRFLDVTGVRTTLLVPLRNDRVTFGCISAHRLEA